MAATKKAAEIAEQEPVLSEPEENVSAEPEETLEVRAKKAGILHPEQYEEEVLENEINARDLVTIHLPKDNFVYKYDVIITNPLTGKIMKIQRGVDVQVPRCVKEILDNAQIQNNTAAKRQEELIESFRTAERDNT